MDIEHIAIERIKIASELSLSYYGVPVTLCYSGGKDSDVLLELTRRSGVPYRVQHSHTTVDAPQTVNHVRNTFRRLELQGIKTIYTMPKLTMWQLIIKKKMPPTRLVRYCCSEQKENFGSNLHIMTGVRKDESNARRKRDVYETFTRDIKKKVYLDDNDDRRKLTEICAVKGKTTTNPIIDWRDNEVWDFLSDAKVKCNLLYEMGFCRVGCIGCAMARKRMREYEFQMFPTYKRTYIRTFDKMLDARKAAGLENNPKWDNGENVFRWWMEEKFVAGQLELEEYEENGL